MRASSLAAFFLAPLLLLACATCTVAVRVDGNVKSKRPIVFVSKFAMLPKHNSYGTSDEYGKLGFQISHNYSLSGTQSPFLLLFFDTWHSYLDTNSAGASESDCADRVDRADCWFSLRGGAGSTSCKRGSIKVKRDPETRSWLANGQFELTGGQAAFVSVAFANCDRTCEDVYCNSDSFFKYEVHWTNSEAYPNREYSFDEFGLYQLTALVFALQSVLCVMAFIVYAALTRVNRNHTTAKILYCVAFLQWISALMALVYHMRFAHSGDLNRVLLLTVFAVHSFAELLFIVLLFGIAAGWTIVRRKLPIRDRVKLSVFGVTFYVLALATGVIFYIVSESNDSVYLYESPPGIMLLVLYVVMATRFVQIAKHTVTQFRKKKRFFRKFVSFYTCYFLHIPCAVLLGLAMDAYTRALTVTVVNQIVWIVAQVVLLVLYHPKWGAFFGTFPFHASTTDLSAVARAETVRVAGQGGSTMSITGGKHSSVDDLGRPIPTNAYDRLYLSRIKGVSISLSERATQLSMYSAQLRQLLDRVAVEPAFSERDMRERRRRGQSVPRGVGGGSRERAPPATEDRGRSRDQRRRRGRRGRSQGSRRNLWDSDGSSDDTVSSYSDYDDTRNSRDIRRPPLPGGSGRSSRNNSGLPSRARGASRSSDRARNEMEGQRDVELGRSISARDPQAAGVEAALNEAIPADSYAGRVTTRDDTHTKL